MGFRLRVHEFLQSIVREHDLPTGFDGSCFSCPIAGKRAPKLVNGKLKRILEKCAQSRRPHVLVHAADLAQELQDSVMNDVQPELFT